MHQYLVEAYASIDVPRQPGKASESEKDMSNVHAVDFRLRSERAPTRTSTTAVSQSVTRRDTQWAEKDAKAMRWAVVGAAVAGVMVFIFIKTGMFGVWGDPTIQYEQPAPPAHQIVQPAR